VRDRQRPNATKSLELCSHPPTSVESLTNCEKVPYNLAPSRSPPTMVETRRTTRVTRSDAQRGPKSFIRIQAPKTNGVASTGQTKRKAIQEIAQKGKGKKRAKNKQPSYLQRSHEAENDPNHDIRLLNLPRDIFDEITTWLQPDALICLSLTCKEILNIVGRESWTECRSKRQYWDQTKRSWINFRHSLIPLLGRDAPHLMVCDTCMTLHPPPKPPREHRETKLTKHCFGQWSTSTTSRMMSSADITFSGGMLRRLESR
jgi:hypothetical protein